MLRSFLPVGQGALYLEQFQNGVNIVFDCGSSTSVELVKDQIHNTFQRREPIEAVFLSHMDEDHVNGLGELLSYCRVKRVYLPYLNETEKVLTKMGLLLEGEETRRLVEESLSWKLLEDPMGTILTITSQAEHEEPDIYFVMPEGIEDEVYDQRFGVRYHRSGWPVSLEKLRIGDSAHRWVFVPFNFQFMNRQKCFVKALVDHGVIGNEKALAELSEKLRNRNVWAKLKPILKEIYKKDIPGSINTNSMTLYSGWSQQEYRDGQSVFRLHSHHKNGCCKRCLYCEQIASGCLYTGDYHAAEDANWRELKERYIGYWRDIGIMQVPHHSSRHSFRPEIADENFWFVISVGEKNRYRHPHATVLKALLQSTSMVSVVTENQGSMLMAEVFGI